MLNQISDTKGIPEESPSPGLGISPPFSAQKAALR